MGACHGSRGLPLVDVKPLEVAGQEDTKHRVLRGDLSGGVLRRQPASSEQRHRHSSIGCKRRCSKRATAVKVNRNVTVVEFTRETGGGDGVPGDRTLVPLGLGKLARISYQPLMQERPRDRRPIEESKWLDSDARIRVLRQAAGKDAKFYRALRRHRYETKQILNDRDAAVHEDKLHLSLMPKSMDDAVKRAQLLSENVSSGSCGMP